MRLLIDDRFATALLTTPMTSNWVTPPPDLTVELAPGLTAEQIGIADAALAPSTALLRLGASHVVLRDLAVIADAVGAIAMRTPVRPDEIERSAVQLQEASGLAETLARATLRPYYGIDSSGWTHDPGSREATSAEVVIVEDAEALREPEAGFSEDLVRAWFILTAQPVVTHVLLLPRDIPPDHLHTVILFIDAVRAAGLTRRGEWLPALASREDVPRERASAFWAAQRLALESADERSLLDLLRGGSPDGSGPNLAGVEFISGRDAA